MNAAINIAALSLYGSTFSLNIPTSFNIHKHQYYHIRVNSFVSFEGKTPEKCAIHKTINYYYCINACIHNIYYLKLINKLNNLYHITRTILLQIYIHT